MIKVTPGSSWRVLRGGIYPPGTLPGMHSTLYVPSRYPVGAPSRAVPPDVAAGGACVHRMDGSFRTFGGLPVPPSGLF